MSFFQITHMTKVSTQIHSSICQYDVHKVSSKWNEWKVSVRQWCQSQLFFGGVSSGLGSRNFAGFQIVSNQYTMLMTPYHPPISRSIKQYYNQSTHFVKKNTYEVLFYPSSTAASTWIFMFMVTWGRDWPVWCGSSEMSLKPNSECFTNPYYIYIYVYI